MTSLRSFFITPAQGGSARGPARPGPRRRLGAVLRPAATVLSLTGLALGVGVVAAPPLPVLNDPTRPPAVLSAPQPGPAASGRAGAAEPGGAAAHAEPARVAPQPRLQSVQLRSGGGASALIDDRMVRVGDSVGERVVAAIDNEGVLLRGAGGERRLRLLGGDEKQPPGSIQITRSARWQAEPEAGAPALAGASAPARAAPVSLAERTHP